jgi:hypothetical protein
MASRSGDQDTALAVAPRIAIREALEKSSADWRFWATASAELATLMEAAPEELLSSIEEQLRAAPTPFLALFKQEGTAVIGACYHSGLLWALERAAMSPDYFSRASLALAGLAYIDPGGKYSNRPLESLRGLFLGWLHNSDVSDEERLKVLDLIIARIPDVGWKLLMAVIPGGHDTVSAREPARYRSWGEQLSQPPSVRAYADFASQLVQRVVAGVGSDPERWEPALQHVSSFSNDFKESLVSKLEGETAGLKDPLAWHAVRSRLREILHRHRAYPAAADSMSTYLARLDVLYDKLRPADPVLADAWLFADWPDLPEGGRPTDAGLTARFEEIQKEAFAAIYSQEGVAGISSLIEASPHSGRVGVIAGTFFSADTAIQNVIIAGLSSDRAADQLFAHQAIGAIYQAGGWSALDPLLADAKITGTTPSGLGVFYLSPAADKETWNRLELEAEPVQRSYWTRLTPWTLNRLSPVDYEYGVGKLLDYDRAPDVLDSMAYGRDDIPASLMIRALELAPAHLAIARANSSPVRVSSHDIAQVFAKLDKAAIDPKIIARLEVPFVSILTHDRPTLALHREVADDPTIFADLVSWAFKRSDGQTDDDAVSEDERRGRGTIAYFTLHHASILPGQNPDGTIDTRKQLEWVQEAKRLCVERNRDEIGRQVIGQVLGCAPAGTDGIWPAEAVRQTLDILSDREIGTGFTTRKRNLRGIVSRSLTGAGADERAIAAAYRKNAAALRTEYPFTSSLLVDLATSHEHEAKYHDDDSAWMDR